MFSLDLTEQLYSWKMVTDTNGTTPSPRNKHSCWVHRDRSVWESCSSFSSKVLLIVYLLFKNVCSQPYTCEMLSRCRLIYFGGYGCKTIGEVRNTSSTSFIVEEMSWVNPSQPLTIISYTMFTVSHVACLVPMFFQSCLLDGNRKRVVQVLGLEQWSQRVWHTHCYVEHARDPGV